MIGAAVIVVGEGWEAPGSVLNVAPTSLRITYQHPAGARTGWFHNDPGFPRHGRLIAPGFDAAPVFRLA